MTLDNFRTIELVWDKANKSIIKTIKTASSDTTGRYLSVKILDGGQEVTLNNAKLQLYWEHPNFNTSGTDDFNTINNGGLFKMTFSDEMLTNVGELNAHLVLTLSDGKITSDGFPIKVFKGTDDGVVVPTNGKGLVEQVARKIDKGNVTLGDLTQEVKLAMTGGSVAVVGEDAVGTENIKDGAVTLSKLKINGFLPKTLSFSPGPFPGYPGYSRLHALINEFSAGDVIKSTDPNYQIAIFRKASDDAPWPSVAGWASEILLTASMLDSPASVSVKHIEDANLSNLVDTVTSVIEVYDSETALQKYQVEDAINNKIESLDLDTTGLSAIGRPDENIIYNGLMTESVEATQNYKDEYIALNAILNAENVDGQMVIKPGGYWFVRFYPRGLDGKDKMYFRVSILQGFKKFKQSVRTVSGDGTTTYYYLEEPKSEMSVDIPSDILGYSAFELRFDNRTGTEDLIIDYALANFYDNISTLNLVSQPTKSQGGSVIKYVSLSGSDSNNGDSIQSAYATLQRALGAINGVGTIICERGIYYNQTVSYVGKDITILPYEDTYDDSTPNRQLIEFRGSDVISSWQASNGVYRASYTGNDFFDKVFVSKTLPPETTSSRPSYNAVLWEGNNGVDDYKMKPVLTLAECTAEVGTFFYDGTHVYVNAKDISNEFNAVKMGGGIRISSDKLTIHDFRSDFYTGVPMLLANVKDLTAINCEANHSSTGNGFGLNFTNAVMTNCRGHKNRNDGFNMHFYGDTTLINCKGLNNYDDGVSHHEQCTGTIIGGEYSGNGKGGIIPVNGSTIQVYGAVMEDNYYGFYNESDNAVSQGNFYKGNAIAIRNLATKPLRSINDTFVGNTDSDLASNNVTPYGETIIS